MWVRRRVRASVRVRASCPKRDRVARTCKECQEPWDGVEVRHEADVVKVCGQLGVVKGQELAEDGQRVLQNMRVVVRKKVVQEPRNEGLQCCKGLMLPIKVEDQERRAHRVQAWAPSRSLPVSLAPSRLTLAQGGTRAALRPCRHNHAPCQYTSLSLTATQAFSRDRSLWWPSGDAISG